jgi:PAS domain S-box-containing protein
MSVKRQTWQTSGTWFILVFMLGMGLSVLATLWTYQNISDKAEAEFHRLSTRTSLEVAMRFDKPVYGLNGLRGLYATQTRVSRIDFSTHVATRNLPLEFPGVRGFGFIQRVQQADLATFVAAERADGAPDFAVHQLSDKTHDDLYIVKLIEPAAQNAGAQGLDAGSEPSRRVAAEQAIGTGLPTISGGIKLVQDNKRTPGVLLYVPVYNQGTRPAEEAARRTSLVGLLYAPIVVQELLAGIPDVVSGLLDFEVYDSALNAPNGNLLFDADKHVAKGASEGVPLEANRRFSNRQALNLSGRQFTLSMNSTPQFDALIDRTVPLVVLVGGTLTTLLLSLLMHLQAGSQKKAERLAHAMTADLDRLAQVVKHSSNAAMLSDANGVITWVNEGFTRLTGYRLDEAVGKTPGELIGSEKGDHATIQKLLDAQASGTICRVEILNRAKDGHEYWIDTEIQPQFDADHKIIGFMEIGTDITALRQTQTRMELAQRDANSLLGTLNLHAIVSVANRAGVITEVNDAFCNISGYSREMLIGQTHHIVNSGYHSPDFFVDMWRDIANGYPWRGQVCNRAKDGSLYWVDTFIASYMGDDGVAEKYVSIRTDITVSKLAELELRKVEATLRTNVALLDSVLENLPCGLSVFDSNLTLRTSNAEFRRLLDLPDSMGGEPLNRFEDIIRFNAERGEYGKASTLNLAATVNTIIERARAPAVKHQFERVRPNDTALEIRGGPMPGGGFITTYTDITQRHRVQLENQRITEALVHATHVAQEASKSKSQFLANMSHEIRTPMNAILGMLALLLKTSLTTSQADYAVKAEGAARALLGLLNEILDFSKIEANKMTLDLQPFRVDTLVRDLSVIVAANIGSRPLEVVFAVDPALPPYLVGDAMRLQQVLVNLSGNAIKFTPAGKVVVSIAVKGQDTHTVRLEFAVQDTGIGIAPDNQTRIFTGFTQAEASTTRRFGGTGLGLAISQRLVALMGGDLRLTSTLDEGSRFYFEVTLPYQRTLGDAAADTTDILPTQRLPTGPRLAGLRVLVVEDNANNQQVARELLQLEGATVHLANHGQEAIDAIESSTFTADSNPGFDAVLMDLQMPVMDGFTATHHIRHVMDLKDLPIIAMTANAMDSDRDACLAAGMNGHVGKPFDLDHLVQVLQQLAAPSWVRPAARVDGPRRPAQGEWLEVDLAAQAAGVNLPAALNRLGYNVVLYERTLRLFVSDLDALPVQLHAYQLAGDVLSAKRALHTLKGLAATLGAEALATVADQGETQLKGSAANTDLPAVVTRTNTTIALASPSLSALLQTLVASPSAPASTTSAPPIDTPPLDTAALAKTLDALADKLGNFDMDAIQLMDYLKQHFGPGLQAFGPLGAQKSQGAQTLDALEGAIDRLDFAQALRLCQTLTQLTKDL